MLYGFAQANGYQNGAQRSPKRVPPKVPFSTYAHFDGNQIKNMDIMKFNLSIVSAQNKNNWKYEDIIMRIR